MHSSIVTLDSANAEKENLVTPSKPYKKAAIGLCIALTLVTCASASIIAWLATDTCSTIENDSPTVEDYKKTDTCSAIEHDPPTVEDYKKTFDCFDKLGLKMDHLQRYYDGHHPGNYTVYSGNGTANVIEVTDEPDVMPDSQAQSPHRQLLLADDVKAIKATGRDIYEVWQLVKGKSTIANAGYLSVVPEGDWMSVDGPWNRHGYQPGDPLPSPEKPFGLRKPDCNGYTHSWVDWHLTYQANGKFIQNAVIVVENIQVGWGMNMEVSVTPGTAPVNQGTLAEPNAQAQFTIVFGLQGYGSSWKRKTVLLSFDAQGHVNVVEDTGSIC